MKKPPAKSKPDWSQVLKALNQYIAYCESDEYDPDFEELEYMPIIPAVINAVYGSDGVDYVNHLTK